MRILFIIRSAEHFLRYDSIIGALCRAGHAVTVLFDKEWSGERDVAAVEAYREAFPGLTYGWLINRDDAWTGILFFARTLITHRRYQMLEGQSQFFGDRWKRYMPFWLRALVSLPGAPSIIATAWCERMLRVVERRAPADRTICAQIAEYHPDVVISPVGGIRVMSPNTEYLKAAHALGIPTASPTVSWDSLTTKASITVIPDVLLLWNEFHRARAIEHHGVPDARIRTIGAPVFDRWFSGLRPSCTKTEFSRRYGLPAEGRYVLYLGSASGTAKNETWLIRELRKKLDTATDPELRNLTVVVRPHPSNGKVYKDFSVPGVVFIGKGRGTPEVELQRSFDTYYHAEAVVGIFTSAMMEAQIVDKPVLVLMTDEYEETQREAQHFQDFIKGDSLELSTLDAFPEKLKEILQGNDRRKEKRRKFVVSYIRPLGLTVSAGEAAVREIEQLVMRTREESRKKQ